MGDQVDVLLINPPWSALTSPSIQLSILKPIVRATGYSCAVLYANLQLATFIEPQVYAKFHTNRQLMHLGEWLFSEPVFGKFAPNDVPSQSYLEYIESRVGRVLDDLKGGKSDSEDHSKKYSFLNDNLGSDFRELITKFKERQLPEFLCRIGDLAVQQRPRLIGFTSTFNQNIPSLALAKTIRSRLPDAKFVMGGANCEGEMGPALLRSFPFLNCVVSGEGEATLAALLRILLEGETQDGPRLESLRGISYRDATGGAHTNPPAEPIKDFEAYPMMDCDDYFEQAAQLERVYGVKIEDGPIYFECSRGCWWGQHSHCTFCGLNGLTINYRFKSPDRVFDELLTLSQRHRVLHFTATDNILNPAFFATLLPRIEETGLNFELFFEVKANMTKRHVKRLADSGVKIVQPGIESLSSHVLRLMGKGTTRLQNIQALKWFAEFRIYPEWNMICGFPGETEEDYSIIEETIPLLNHLAPSGAMTPIELHRFSPNFDFAEKLGFVNVRPRTDYRYVYDLDNETLMSIAYVFDYELPGFEKFWPYIGRINRLIEDWRKEYYEHAAMLRYLRGPGFVRVWDGRVHPHIEFALEGKELDVFLICDRISTYEEIYLLLRDNDPGVTRRQLDDVLQSLITRRVLIREDEKFLTLATAARPVLKQSEETKIPRPSISRMERTMAKYSPLETIGERTKFDADLGGPANV